MSRPLRVIICDDNESDAKLAAHELKRAGWALEERRVETGAELVALLAQPWDLVVSDWSMPSFSARDAVQIVRAHRPDLPVVVMSGSAGDELAAEARKAGADAYVAKDRMVELPGAVMGVLRSTRPVTGAEESVRLPPRPSGSARPVTLEEALRALREEGPFKRLADSGIIGIGIADLMGNVYDVNDYTLKLLGFRRDDPLPTWQTQTPAEFSEGDARAGQQLLQTGVAGPWEKEILGRDGRRVAVLIGAAMLEPPYLLTFMLDQNERKRAEDELRERMRIAALSAEVGLALTKGETLGEMLERCAEAALRHLEVCGVHIWTLNEPLNVLDLQASAGIAWKDEPTRIQMGQYKTGWVAQQKRAFYTDDLTGDPRARSPDWTRREGITGFAAHPMMIDGEVVGVFNIFSREPLDEVARKGLTAITDPIAVGIRRKQVEAAKAALELQLIQAQKMEAVGSLAGGVAHDFNNLLFIILGSTGVALEMLEAGHPAREDLAEVVAAANRAAELTRQLLAFSRRQVLVPRTVDLNEVVLRLETMLRRLLGEDIELGVRPAPGEALVYVDVGQIEQVIMNLVVNARDAMPRGGKLTLELARLELNGDYAARHRGITPGPHVMLAVTDTGVGMDRQTQARIFEPFFTTKEVGRGTGLGLSTVFGIVRQSGGHIWVYSEVGHGSTFKVYLPEALSERGHERTSRQTAEVGALRGQETVLLVEDDAAVRRLGREVLRRHGYQVLEAANGTQALKLAEAHEGPIDLLLSDVIMPGMSGPQLAKRLCAERPTLRVLYMSGYPDESIVRHELVASEAAFLQKPMTAEALAKAVRRVLDA